METNPKPSPAGDNGRGPGGRFGPGNRAGRGNPMAKKVQQLRAALLKAIKPNDIRDVIETMLKSAKGGDIAAGRELLSRALGAPEALDILQRLEALETTLNAKDKP